MGTDRSVLSEGDSDNELSIRRQPIPHNMPIPDQSHYSETNSPIHQRSDNPMSIPEQPDNSISHSEISPQAKYKQSVGGVPSKVQTITQWHFAPYEVQDWDQKNKNLVISSLKETPSGVLLPIKYKRGEKT